MTRMPGAGAGDVLLRVLGGVLALLGGVVTAALTVLLAPLRVSDLGPLGATLADALAVGAVRVPATVLVAVGGGLFFVWFAGRAIGTRWGVLLPAIGWFATVAAALRTTTEGDRLLMPDDWGATVSLFGGTLVIVVGLVLSLTSTTSPRAQGGSGGPRVR